MKKIIFNLLTTMFMFAVTNATAISLPLPDKQFKQLYKKTVEKMTARGMTKIQLKDNALGIVGIQYENRHECLCRNKKCHGPRLTITVNEIKMGVVLFPSGHYFAEVNYAEVNYFGEDGLAVQIARKVLLAYCEK